MSSNVHHGNIRFMAVARVSNGKEAGVIMASHTYNPTEISIDLQGVQKVLDQPDSQIIPGKHYSFTIERNAWHLIAGNSDRDYMYYIKLNLQLIIL